MKTPTIATFAILSIAGLTCFSPIRAQDVGYYALNKEINYVQTSTATPTLDPHQPYQFSAGIDGGETTSSNLLTSSSLTTPTNQTFYFPSDTTTGGSSYELFFQDNFQSKAAMDSAFGSGSYNLTVVTTTTGQYSTQLVIGSDDYPAIPQITSTTNATWSGTNLVVTDVTQPVTLNWSGPGNSVFFSIGNTGISVNNAGNSITIPANTFSAGQYYQGTLLYNNNVPNSNSNPIPNTNGGSVQYLTKTGFIIQAGTPTSSKNLYTVQERQVLTQTGNSTPTGIFGDFGYEDPAPYTFDIESPIAGTVSGPSSSSYPLVFTDTQGSGSGGDYYYSGGAVSSLSALDGAYASGTYTFPDSQSVTLTGDTYPNIPQITLVNGATPTWNAQGRLVLNASIANTITWSSFNTESNPNWHEDVDLESDAAGSYDLEQSAGIATNNTSTFTTLTIPAGSLAPGSTYTGSIQYLLASSGTISGNTIHAAGCASETYFSVLANPADVFNGAPLGDNYNYSPWFGIYNNLYYPWIYRTDLGFIYVDTSDGFNLYLYVDSGNNGGSMGWLYTNEDIYPNVYCFSENTFLYFDGGTTFSNYSTDKFETY